jgi:SAM-dependent methyltransferase
MPSPDNFFIKPGYRFNENSSTYNYDENNDNYWTDERIQNADKFQYHVYLLAAKIAKDSGFKNFMDIGSGPATKAKKILAPIVKDAVLLDQPSCEPLVRKIYPESRFVATNLETSNIKLSFSADLLVCADVLEHLFNPLPCLELCYNHLSSSGVAVFSTPERDILRGPDCNTSPHPAHVREWNRSEFKQLLEYSGFDVVEQILLPAARMHFFEELVWKLNKKSGIFWRVHWKSCQVAICKKR